ncbi:MAG: hypothetical protein AAFR65_15855 [Pseudomonadota bacterium]
MTDRDDQCGVNRGTPIKELRYSSVELDVLTVSRHYCSAFACPVRHGWLTAISTALSTFGHRRGPDIAVAILSVVQTMRGTRQSVFRFNGPDCPACAAFVSSHERALMAAFRATARGRREDAAAHAAILLEGNDPKPFLRALDTLAAQVFAPVSEVSTPQEQDSAPAPVGGR